MGATVVFVEACTGEVVEKKFRTRALCAHWIGTMSWVVAEKILEVNFESVETTLEVA